MTLEELTKLAMARTSEITSTYPATRALAYRRAGVRQREIMALVAGVNPEYYGTCATAPLDENASVDLSDIIEPVPTPELIQVVRIADGGEGSEEDPAYATGTEITIVPAHDLTAELPPRATLRDLVLKGVDDDLEGVVSIEILYSRLSPVYGPSDAGSSIELVEPYNELLAIDLTKMFLRKATRLDAAIRDAAIVELDKEEAPLLAQLLTRATQYAPVVTRSHRPVRR